MCLSGEHDDDGVPSTLFPECQELHEVRVNDTGTSEKPPCM